MDEQVLDPVALDELVEDIGAQEVVALLDTYLDDVSGQVRLLQRALDAGDASTMARAAHTLCSTSALVGARPAARRFRGLELGVEAGDLASLHEPTAEVTRHLAVVCDEVRLVRERLINEQA